MMYEMYCNFFIPCTCTGYWFIWKRSSETVAGLQVAGRPSHTWSGKKLTWGGHKLIVTKSVGNSSENVSFDHIFNKHAMGVWSLLFSPWPPLVCTYLWSLSSDERPDVDFILVLGIRQRAELRVAATWAEGTVTSPVRVNVKKETERNPWNIRYQVLFLDCELDQNCKLVHSTFVHEN